MDDLVFFSQRTLEPLEYDTEGEYAIVEQFQEYWFVRAAQTDVRPYIKVGTKTLELIWSPQFGGFALPDGEKLKKLCDQVKGSAGLIWLFTSPPTGVERPLTPALYIGPGSLTETEFSAILDRLGQISISLGGAALGPVMSPQQTESGSSINHPITTTDRLVASAESFLRLYSALESNWDLIRKTPARQLSLVTALVDTSRSDSTLSARTMQRSVQRPDLRRHETLVPEETDDTAENRYLRFIVKTELLDKASPLARLLRSRAEWLRSGSSQPPQQAGLSYINLWRQRRDAMQGTAWQLGKLAQRIEVAGEQASSWLKEPFLANLSEPVGAPRLLTARLTNSKEYGPVYRAFTEHIQGRSADSTGAEANLLWALQERLIHPSWRLYELWVFVETYAMLIERFGFQSIGKTPLERIRLIGDSAMLKEGETFELEFIPVNGQEAPTRHLRMTIAYGPKLPPEPCKVGKPCFNPGICSKLYCYQAITESGDWTKNQLTPDIVLQLQLPNEETSFMFVMDAKYRRYDKQQSVSEKDRKKYGVENGFDLDLFGTAKMKYSDELSSTAAFIIHSDPDPKFTTFGDNKFTTLPARERISGATEWWPGHKIGAIFVSPVQLTHLERLLRCFLMYHAGFEDVCWSCRKVLTKDNGGLTHQPGWQGDYYQCPDCGRFWIGQVCQNRYEHHRLIKMGRESFHKTLPGKDWQCICPVCGDSPSWESPASADQALAAQNREAR